MKHCQRPGLKADLSPRFCQTPRLIDLLWRVQWEARSRAEPALTVGSEALHSLPIVCPWFRKAGFSSVRKLGGCSFSPSVVAPLTSQSVSLIFCLEVVTPRMYSIRNRSVFCVYICLGVGDSHSILSPGK